MHTNYLIRLSLETRRAVAQRCTTARRVWGLAMFLRQVKTNSPAKGFGSFWSLTLPSQARGPTNHFSQQLRLP